MLATKLVTSGDAVLVEALHGRIPSLIAEAHKIAKYVVIDSPPLGEVSDALRIAEAVDNIIVVARPGHTIRANFEVMRDLLRRTRHTPAGMIVIGETQGMSTRYYESAMGARWNPPAPQRRGLARLRRGSPSESRG